jgi:hypothetical protein
VFNNKYAEVFGATRGTTFTYNVTNFDLPLDSAFGDEINYRHSKSLISSQL